MKYETRVARAHPKLVRREIEPRGRPESRPNGNRIRVAIVGFGTVGKATANIIAQHADSIERRTSLRLEVAAVCRRSGVSAPDKPLGARATADWRELVGDREIDLIVETMGGTEESFKLVQASLALGKPVVTANKKLLAERGEELFALAATRNLPLGFEASVAASIPILRVLQHSTTGDCLRGICGILNGTSNYILTEMESRGIEFDQALREAQDAGYAEADPSLDIDGFDSRDKLCILARMAFGRRLEVSSIPTTGVRRIRSCDIQAATRLDSTIRLIASADEGENGMEVSVRPWMIKRDSLLAKVDGVNNAIVLTGERIGRQMFYGRGAGGDATAAAVVSDLIEIASDLLAGRLSAKRIPGFRASDDTASRGRSRPSRWYVRILSQDRAATANRLAELTIHNQFNIECLPGERESGDLAFVTSQPISEAQLNRMIGAVRSLPCVTEEPLLIRIE